MIIMIRIIVMLIFSFNFSIYTMKTECSVNANEMLELFWLTLQITIELKLWTFSELEWRKKKEKRVSEMQWNGAV